VVFLSPNLQIIPAVSTSNKVLKKFSRRCTLEERRQEFYSLVFSRRFGLIASSVILVYEQFIIVYVEDDRNFNDPKEGWEWKVGSCSSFAEKSRIARQEVSQNGLGFR
jgi:hypothetical protein